MVKRQVITKSPHFASNANVAVKCSYYELDKMKDGFLLEQSCRGNSKVTVEYYKGNITRFIAYLEEQGLDTDTSTITKEQIKKYILYLKNAKKWDKSENIKSDELLTSKSVQTYIRALKAWVAWMEEEEYLDELFSSGIKLPKATSKVIEILTEEEIKEIFKYLDTKKENHLRDLLILVIMIECGLRLEEITIIKFSDIKTNLNTIKVLGKGDKERIVSFGSSLQKMLFKYINQERPEAANKKIDRLFLKSDGMPISQTTIKQLFRKIKDKTKITKLHPHLCRHTYCTMYLANGGGIFSLKQSTGHESFEILNNYVHIASMITHLKEKNLSLLDGMKLKI